jgi:phospholipid/cholesterol/gamma-HCH transport system permease protein
MPAPPPPRATARRSLMHELGRAVLDRLAGAWRTLYLGALILTLCLTPRSYTPAMRSSLARQLYLSCARTLLWFTLLSSLTSVVLIRIVVVTSLSYGLSQYALEMVVRVLVLELIPLSAAVFAALRCAIPHSMQLARLHLAGQVDAKGRPSVDAMTIEILPRALAAAFCVWLLAAVSCVTTLVLAYLSVYGMTRWGVPGYTHVVGQIFDGATSLVFGMKIAFFSLAVAWIPVASVLYDASANRSRTGLEIRSLIRLFVLILLVEIAALITNYA